MSRPAPLLLLPILLCSGAAFADGGRCEHASPRNLSLDLSGVKAVMFEIGANELHVDASPGATAAIEGRACAAEAGLLDRLTLTQERDGDKLIVRARRDDNGLFRIGNQYAYMALRAKVPDDVMVQLDVGSGDAWVTGASALSADVGSGDVEAKRIAGRVTTKVGSGDVTLDDIGALHVLSIGSGDVEAANVRGDAEVGSIGSGDFKLRRAGGNVKIGSIGSGDAELSGIDGNVAIDSIGSGDVDADGVGGNLTLRSVGSGGIDHRGVRGTVDLPRKR